MTTHVVNIVDQSPIVYCITDSCMAWWPEVERGRYNEAILDPGAVDGAQIFEISSLMAGHPSTLAGSHSSVTSLFVPIR